MLDRSFYEKADEIISAHGKDKKSLIPIMQDIQAVYRYIPPEILTYVAKNIGITEAKAYSVATFYENFSFDQKGKYVIKVCDGTACHVRKGTLILERLYKELGLSDDKHTTDDMMFTVETVSCLGACGLAPVMTVNDEVHPAMTPDKVTETIKKISMAFHQTMATHMREVVLTLARRWPAAGGKKMIDTVDDLYEISKQVKG